MKIVDASVLLYAVNRQSIEHAAAHAWLTRALSGNEAVALPWVSLLAFIRLSTSRRIFASPLSPADAMTVVESWLSQPAAVTFDRDFERFDVRV